MALTLVKQNKAFGGWVKQFSHVSNALGGLEAKFSVFLPDVSEKRKVPVVYFLSGLTCTDENFTTKAGAQRMAAELGIALVAPDTSPRGAGVEGEDASYDFGAGAGFYVDATEPAWSKHYNMYSYVTEELPALVDSELPVDPTRRSVMGHSMGGHGALMVALRNPGAFKCASAFSPICNPVDCPWGKKAFAGYLGPDQAAWAAYDSTELAKAYSGRPLPLKIDQGAADNFYTDKQLLPERLEEAAESNDKVLLESGMHDDYDHSYYFISTFMEDHLKWHASHLQ